VITAEEAGILREGDHVYLLAPPARAGELDRFFVDQPAALATPSTAALIDFLVPGGATIGALAEVYGQSIDEDDKPITVTDYFARRLGAQAKKGDTVPLGAVTLIANQIADGRVLSAGLRLTEPEASPMANLTAPVPVRRLWRRLFRLGRKRRYRQRPPQ
jgi:cell volume regulation protein A